MTKEVSSFYITLDTLLDTRLGTLFKIAPTQVESILANGYFDRLYDEFPGIDNAVFKEAYLKRDRETLRNSPLCSVYKMLNYLVNKTLLARVSTPFKTKPEIVLNLYPYQLTDDEANLIVQGVVAVTDKNSDIRVIYEDPLKLRAAEARATYVAMLMYDYPQWLEENAKQGWFEQAACPELFLFGPKLLASNEALKSVNTLNPFGAIEAYASPLVRLTLLEVDQFCITPSRIQQLKKP